MVLYVKTHKDSTKKLSELINESSRVGECKMNTWISVAYLYITKDKFRKISLDTFRKIISFTIISKERK